MEKSTVSTYFKKMHMIFNYNSELMLSFKAFRLLYLIRNCGSCQTDLTIKPCVYVVIPLSQAKLLGYGILNVLSIVIIN